MSESPEDTAMESMRPLLVGAATAATLASRRVQQNAAIQAEQAFGRQQNVSEMRQQFVNTGLGHLVRLVSPGSVGKRISLAGITTGGRDAVIFPRGWEMSVFSDTSNGGHRCGDRSVRSCSAALLRWAHRFQRSAQAASCCSRGSATHAGRCYRSLLHSDPVRPGAGPEAAQPSRTSIQAQAARSCRGVAGSSGL